MACRRARPIRSKDGRGHRARCPAILLLPCGSSLFSLFVCSRLAEVEGYPGTPAVSPSNQSSAAAVPSNADLSDVEAQPVFDIARAVEPARHERLDPGLTRRTTKGSYERVPLRLDFFV